MMACGFVEISILSVQMPVKQSSLCQAETVDEQKEPGIPVRSKVARCESSNCNLSGGTPEVFSPVDKEASESDGEARVESSQLDTEPSDGQNTRPDREQEILLATAGIVIAFFCIAFWKSRQPDEWGGTSRGRGTEMNLSTRRKSSVVTPSVTTGTASRDERLAKTKFLIQHVEPDERLGPLDEAGPTAITDIDEVPSGSVLIDEHE